MWVPLLSLSQSGMTRNAGNPGGIELEGDVSLECELSKNDSVSEVAAPIFPFPFILLIVPFVWMCGNVGLTWVEVRSSGGIGRIPFS